MGRSPSREFHLDALASQLPTPVGWELLRHPRLDAGWLGMLACDLAVLGPGPGGRATHRARLVVFVDDARTPPATPATNRRSPGPRAPDPDAAGLRVVARLALAAAADVPEAWIVVEDEGWTEVYRAPFHGRYRARSLVYPDEAIVPLACTRLRVVPLRARRSR